VSVFVDSNVPMYLIGKPHPQRDDVELALRRLTLDGARLVTSAEVFQELLHRYTGVSRPDLVQAAFDTLRGLVDDVFDVTLADVDLARDVVRSYPVSARDAVHVSVMRRHRVSRILSLDRGFDAVPGIERIG
jgi:predicted nucleic acid-binding protein